MNVTRKDAEITNVGADDDFPGSFQVVLSTPAKDRDGDELATEDWKQPLPDHITFDIDHGMSVEKTVGSGRPYLDEQGRVIVDGTYSSLPKAQDTRTLVKEGHIRTVSVAFMSEKQTKDGKTKTVRELLNGAFVAIPSNREAVVLASKGIDAKAGARHSSTDMARIQSIHDHAVALGATPADDTGAAEGAAGGKSAAAQAATLSDQVATLTAKVAELTKKPVTVSLDGKTLATAVIKDSAFDGVINEITHALVGKTAPEPATRTLNDAVTALAAVDVKSLPEPVANAIQGLLDAIETAQNPDAETTPPVDEKSTDADALALQYKAIEIAALAG